MIQLNNNKTDVLIEDVKRLLNEYPEDAGLNINLPGDYNREPVFDIYNSGPIITNAKQISQPEVFDKFKRLLNELVLSDNEEEAFNYTLLLEEVLYKKYESLKTENRRLYLQYEELLNIARFVCITTLNQDEIETLIGKYLVTSLKHGVNVKIKIDDALIHYDDFIKEGEVAKRFYESMGKSTELLSDVVILDPQSGKEVPGELKFWLLDYVAFSVSTREEKRSSFQRINYIQKSPNVKKLDGKLQEILRKILEIYDWLAFGTESSLDEEFDERYVENDFKTVNTEQVKLSNNLNGLGKPTTVVNSTPTKKLDIQDILNKGSGVRMSNEISNDPSSRADESSRYGAGKFQISNTKQQAELNEREVGRVPPVAPIKKVESPIVVNSSVQREGDNENLLQIKQEIERKKQQAHAVIDKRLENLKNRKANN